MSTADELAKLDVLRKSGVLTQEEFNAEKAKLLGEVSPLRESDSPSEAGSSQGTGGRPTPDLFPLPSPHFLVFARDGKMDFGWEESGFYIKARERTRHSFPLTIDGWQSAWEIMSSNYPQLAAKVADAVERSNLEQARRQHVSLKNSSDLGG
jgi:hypothetical protein